MLVLPDKRCTTEGAILRVHRCGYSWLSFGVFTVLLFSFLLCSYYFSSELGLINYSLIFFFFLLPLSDGRTIACALRAKTAGWSVCLLTVQQIPIE